MARKRTREEIVDALTRAMFDVLRRPSRKTMLFPSKTEIFEVARTRYGLRGQGTKAVHDEAWAELRERVRVVIDTSDDKAGEVARYFRIGQIRIADSPEAIPDEAARLHTEIVEPNSTCFYSCGETLAETVRRAAESGLYRTGFTACSSVVLSADAPAAMPPGSITAAFHRRQLGVKTMSYQLPLEVQDTLAPSEDASKRRALREAIERAVFSKAADARHLWLGIGTLHQPGAFRDHCKPAVIAALEEHGAVGEVGFMPFSKAGLIYDDLGLAKGARDNRVNWAKLADPLRRFFNSTFVLKFALLRPDTQVVVVAGGHRKQRAIWHGLRFLRRPREQQGLGGLAYLVTDQATLDGLHREVQRDKVGGRSSDGPA